MRLASFHFLATLDFEALQALKSACRDGFVSVMQEYATGKLKVCEVEAAGTRGHVALRLEQTAEGRELVVVAASGSVGFLRAIEKPVRALAADWGADTIRAHCATSAMARLHRAVGFTNTVRANGEFISYAAAGA